MAGWLGQVPGFRYSRWWKKTIAVFVYAVIFLLIAGGLFGGGLHALVAKVLGMAGFVVYLKVGPWVNALGPPYIATEAFLTLVYILNARLSTFLLGAESLAIILLATNAWGVRFHIPLLNSTSKAHLRESRRVHEIIRRKGENAGLFAHMPFQRPPWM